MSIDPGSAGKASRFRPESLTVFREGYRLGDFRVDLVAGLTVAIVALPLSMALAIASGTTPEKGLITAIVAGFLISALGGSRHQVGGPTGAFVAVVYAVIQAHGYDGLVLATLMAGVIVFVGGLLRFGDYIKYIPQPVVVGFTAGIAVIIFSSQVKDFLGLETGKLPDDVPGQWEAYLSSLRTIDPAASLVALASLAAIIVMRRLRPRWPNFLFAAIGASLVVQLGGVPAETIGDRFGTIPNMIPLPSLPEITGARLWELLPSALTIAFLAAVESLLSAMVADGMTKRRHASNTELVAQGIANSAAALFGGLPATGAIARTATNIRSGARSPVAGMLHAVFVFLFMLTLAPAAENVPMAALAAILVMVAWNMSEVRLVRRILLRASNGERAQLVVTLALTVLVDLTVAIEVGVVLAAIVFMHRMAGAVAIQASGEANAPGGAQGFDAATLPPGVAALQVQGPLFFGVAERLVGAYDRIGQWPSALIIKLGLVPFVDVTGAMALTDLIRRARSQGAVVVLAEVAPSVAEALHGFGVSADEQVEIVTSMEEALRAIERQRLPVSTVWVDGHPA